MELNDELLCAYLDGELDAATRVRVVTALETDTGGRVRLERMRAADRRLRQEIPVPPAVVDDPLVQVILKEDGWRPVSTRVSRFRWYTMAALAAGLAGVVLGWLLATQRGAEPRFADDARAVGLLHSVLESGASGTHLTRDGEGASVMLTTVAADGRVCRLFGTTQPGRAAEGVACREAGAWRIVAWDSVAPSAGEYRPAGASPLLDAVLDRVGGEPLTAQEEQALLARSWRTAK